MEKKEVIKMTKRVLIFFLALAVVIAFSLPLFAQNVVIGKIQVLDKVAKKITINKTVYSLSDEAARATFKVGDEVEATIEGKVVKKLVRALQ
jgi:Cu/Ag efflux protein CusF